MKRYLMRSGTHCVDGMVTFVVFVIRPCLWSVIVGIFPRSKWPRQIRFVGECGCCCWGFLCWFSLLV